MGMWKDTACPCWRQGPCWAAAGGRQGWALESTCQSQLQMSALGDQGCQGWETDKWWLHHCPKARWKLTHALSKCLLCLTAPGPNEFAR